MNPFIGETGFTLELVDFLTEMANLLLELLFFLEVIFDYLVGGRVHQVNVGYGTFAIPSIATLQTSGRDHRLNALFPLDLTIL